MGSSNKNWWQDSCWYYIRKFFTKKYIEFKNYFEEKTYLLIKGEIKPRWSDSKYKPKNADSNQEFDKVISNISLIDDTFLSSKKELIITIKSDILNSEINHDLYSVILPPQSKGGNQLLTVNYIDMDNNTTYNLKSHKRIIITNELINALELYCDKYNIEFKLNQENYHQYIIIKLYLCAWKSEDNNN